MYPLNPRFKKCVMDITKKFSIPEKDVWKLISAKPLNSSFHEPEEVEPGLFRIKPVEDVISDYVAAFDMDHTLSYAQSKLFPSDPDDIFVLPRRREVLEGLIKKGYKLLLFTNQFSRGKKQVNNKVNRVATFLKKLDLPMTAYIATKKDHNRKPENGMWEYFTSHNMPVKKAVFCGDALGRPGDFSDSDKMFGVNSGMKVLTPEESFPGVLVRLSQHPKRAIIFVGAPGVGKSTVYKNSFPDFVHINQDNLGTRSKVLRAIKQNIGKNMVIDSTNSSQKKRQEIYDLLPDDYDIQVLYFVNDGRRGNALRTGKAHVPDIAYHLYFKHLTPPEKSEFGAHSGDVHVINGRTASIKILKPLKPLKTGKWLTGVEAGRALFESSDAADFTRALSLYDTIVSRLAADYKPKKRKSGDVNTRWGEKPVVMRNLVENDLWWRETLPQLLVKLGHMNKNDMRTLLAWKWGRGQYRPGRANFEKKNTEESVIAATEACLKAAKPLEDANDNKIINATIRSAVTAATKMAQVGPATATAILAARFPEKCPFYSDEAMESVGMFREPSTLSRYLKFAQVLREKASALGKDWTAEKVGRALWAASKAHALGLSDADPVTTCLGVQLE